MSPISPTWRAAQCRCAGDGLGRARRADLTRRCASGTRRRRSRWSARRYADRSRRTIAASPISCRTRSTPRSPAATGYFDTPRGLCRRERSQGQSHQAAGDHGSGRRQRAVPEFGQVADAGAALVAATATPSPSLATRTAIRRSMSPGSAATRSKLIDNAPMSFAPRFSPDGGTVAFSVSNGGTTNIYVGRRQWRQARRS